MSTSSGSKALKSGIWYTIANFVTSGIGFLTMPIFTRLMSKGDIGSYSNFTSWLSILRCVITLNLAPSIALAKFDYGERLDDYIASILVLGSLSTAAIYLVAVLFEPFLLSVLGFDQLQFHVVFCFCLTAPALEAMQTRGRMEYRYKLTVSLSLISVLVGTGISLICVLTSEDKLVMRILGQYLPMIALNLGLYVYSMKRARTVSTAYWRYALRISLPLIVHVLSGYLLSFSDRIMINNMCGSESTAYYSVAYSCSMVVSVLWTSFNQAWAPWSYEQMNKGDIDRLKKASRPYLLCFAGIVLCFFLAGPEILMLMGGRAYMPALPVIPPVMTGIVFQFVNTLYINIETYSKKQKYIAFGTTVAATVNIALNYLLIPVYGYVAAAYTTLFGYMVLFLIHYLLVRRLGKDSWCDNRFSFLLLGAFLVVMFLMFPLYENTALRYGLIAVIGCLGIGFAIVFRNDLIEIVRNHSTAKLKAHVKTLTRRK